MKKKVCAFVWNNFTTDARVFKECSSLAEAGFQVQLLCIQDSNDLPKEEIVNGFKVKRVEKYPSIYFKIKQFGNKMKELIRYKLNSKVQLILIFPLIICIFPVFIIIYSIYKILKFTRVLKLYYIFRVIIKMILEGVKYDADIYHSNDLNTLPQGYICKLIRKAKLVYDSHEVQTSRTGYKGKRYYYLEKYFIKRIDNMIMTTDIRADYTQKLYGIQKPIVIHNYQITRKENNGGKIDLYKLADIPKDEPILLYQGGLQEGRGLEELIYAIPKFNKGIVVFIGFGKLENKLKRMCEINHINHRVRFVGKVMNKDLLDYTENAYLGFQVIQNTCFNHYSAISNKLLEYMMVSVPVISSNFPEMKRIVEGYNIGICIDPHNSENIADAVNYMLREKKFYEECKSNCKVASKILNWENEKQNFIDIYLNL